MPLILLIETGTAVCSVGIARNSEILSLRENADGRAHAQLTAPFIEEILAEQGLRLARIDAVAVSEGPGSYTGLRVGISTAKGICYATGKPLIAINSLRSLAQLAIDRRLLPTPHCLIAPMIDARRTEVYTALFNARGEAISETAAQIIDDTSFADLLPKQPILFVGDGAEKCKPFLRHPHAVFADLTASAAGMAIPAAEAFARQQFVDVAYFEPFYLKDFMIIPARGK